MLPNHAGYSLRPAFQRPLPLGSLLLGVAGTLQREGDGEHAVVHLIAKRQQDILILSPAEAGVRSIGYVIDGTSGRVVDSFTRGISPSRQRRVRLSNSMLTRNRFVRQGLPVGLMWRST